MVAYKTGCVLLANQQPGVDAPQVGPRADSQRRSAVQATGNPILSIRTQVNKSTPSASIGAFGGLAKKKPLAHRAAANVSFSQLLSCSA
jgi:hypothetical protein